MSIGIITQTGPGARPDWSKLAGDILQHVSFTKGWFTKTYSILEKSQVPPKF